MKIWPYMSVASLPVVQGFHQLVVQVVSRYLEQGYAVTARVPNLELG
jgi:hypothetical protein